MNKIALITGASRGIGAATARLAAERGYAVCVNYLRNRVAAEKVVGEIEKSGGKAIAVAADVASESDVVRLFGTVDKQLGSVTALVNNAGMLEKQSRLFRSQKDGCLDRPHSEVPGQNETPFPRFWSLFPLVPIVLHGHLQDKSDESPTRPVPFGLRVEPL